MSFHNFFRHSQENLRPHFQKLVKLILCNLSLIIIPSCSEETSAGATQEPTIAGGSVKPPSSSNSAVGGAIGGAVVGVLVIAVGIVIVAVIMVVIVQRKRKNKRDMPLGNAEYNGGRGFDHV